MSDLIVTEGFGLIDHIKALDERVGKLEVKVFGESSASLIAGEYPKFGEQSEAVATEQYEAHKAAEAENVQHEDSQPGL